MIEFQDATKAFITPDSKLTWAMQNVTFAVREGEFVAVVGPSGCGKTTTLNVLAGLTDLTRGRALVRGLDPERSRLDIGYVFQEDTVLPWRRVIDNIMIGPLIRGASRAEARERAMRQVSRMALDGFERAYPAQLSGGMRKRVALASVMVYDPAILLMDEPYGALDAQTRLIMQEELLRIWAANRKTVLFVTHDLTEAISLADRVIVMTARPARVKAEYIVDLPRDRTAADARRDPRFDELYERIWDDLRPENSMGAEVS